MLASSGLSFVMFMFLAGIIFFFFWTHIPWRLQKPVSRFYDFQVSWERQNPSRHFRMMLRLRCNHCLYNPDPQGNPEPQPWLCSFSEAVFLHGNHQAQSVDRDVVVRNTERGLSSQLQAESKILFWCLWDAWLLFCFIKYMQQAVTYPSKYEVGKITQPESNFQAQPQCLGVLRETKLIEGG